MQALKMQTYVGERDDTGKRRIVTSIFKDEFLEVTWTMHADDAERWAAQLLEMAQEARGKQVIIPS